MTEISYFFKTRVKGSVTPLIYGRDAKDLRDSEGSTKLKNIQTKIGFDFSKRQDLIHLFRESGLNTQCS